MKDNPEPEECNGLRVFDLDRWVSEVMEHVPNAHIDMAHPLMRSRFRNLLSRHAGWLVQELEFAFVKAAERGIQNQKQRIMGRKPRSVRAKRKPKVCPVVYMTEGATKDEKDRKGNKPELVQ